MQVEKKKTRGDVYIVELWAANEQLKNVRFILIAAMKATKYRNERNVTCEVEICNCFQVMI